jgi:hypothetical protein
LAQTTHTDQVERSKVNKYIAKGFYLFFVVEIQQPDAMVNNHDNQL